MDSPLAQKYNYFCRIVAPRQAAIAKRLTPKISILIVSFIRVITIGLQKDSRAPTCVCRGSVRRTCAPAVRVRPQGRLQECGVFAPRSCDRIPNNFMTLNRTHLVTEWQPNPSLSRLCPQPHRTAITSPTNTTAPTHIARHLRRMSASHSRTHLRSTCDRVGGVHRSMAPVGMPRPRRPARSARKRC